MLGIVLMLVAAALNATASVLQRRAARDEPESRSFSAQLMLDLIRRPAWLLGILAMLGGFVLHAVSISVSRIALVQPVLVIELPFTLLAASWMFGLRLGRRDWTAIGLQSVGLGMLVGCLAPSGGDPGTVPGATWALGIALTAAGIVALVVLGLRARQGRRAAFLGVATGAAFGLNSSLIAGVGAAVSRGDGLFTTWQTYAVAVVGPVSFFLLQNALESGTLVASQPGFTLTNPAVSVAWGLAVFGEQARGGGFLAAGVIGAVLVGVGTLLLARSPLLESDTSSGAGPDAGTGGGSAPPRGDVREPATGSRRPGE
ncbi:hypothetical protein Psed_6023 [Pseudonocardia dioxanivorans CB1190]|uniref:Integral membrane protein n=1 Tax=Pseudonocardia dioxanivorans (strain ATCC 55486 / DSM 44775 / JCM 13855 / CB1190) TaxID=675635 RepID=F4CK31_PSEUX|nr:DMT family transporter [Pseudonocardia dioxanivorans]AEA28137.1 hypothetical protein Psed_6023 [Pseudonocardia dioxanivorans CB1190]